MFNTVFNKYNFLFTSKKLYTRAIKLNNNMGNTQLKHHWCTKVYVEGEKGAHLEFQKI